MSIFLKPVQRANPSDPDAPKKWYPVQYTTKRQPVRPGRAEEMVSRAVHHEDGGRERSGYADSR